MLFYLFTDIEVWDLISFSSRGIDCEVKKIIQCASVVELVDTLVLGTSASGVRVRVPSLAYLFETET